MSDQDQCARAASMLADVLADEEGHDATAIACAFFAVAVEVMKADGKSFSFGMMTELAGQRLVRQSLKMEH